MGGARARLAPGAHSLCLRAMSAALSPSAVRRRTVAGVATDSSCPTCAQTLPHLRRAPVGGGLSVWEVCVPLRSGEWGWGVVGTTVAAPFKQPTCKGVQPSPSASSVAPTPTSAATASALSPDAA